MASGIPYILPSPCRFQVEGDVVEDEATISEEPMALWKSSVPPIHYLPPEILAEIFEIRTVGDSGLENEDFPGSLDTRKAPWMVGQVCPVWRSVATSTPSLWTRINISWKKKVSEHCAVLLEALLNIQLERARDQCLVLSYYSEPESETGLPDERLREKFFSMICSRVSQWKTARLKGNMNSLDHLQHLHGAFRSLKRLEIQFLGDVQTLDTITACCAFEDCPSLTELSLRAKAQVVFRIPWKQITRYESRQNYGWTPYLEDHIQTLPKLERVEVCILSSAWQNVDVSQLPLNSPLKLCFLHTLVINDNHYLPGSASTLMSWLVLPALRVLRISVDSSYTDTMLEFLDRSQCSLEELAFPVICCEGDNESRHSIIRFLKASALHSLRTFQIGGRSRYRCSYEPMWEIVLESLTLEREGKAQVMPRLRRLVFDDLGDVIPNPTLLTMLSSRCFITSEVSDNFGGHRLEELALWNFGREHEKDRTPSQQTTVDHLMEFSSSSGLACRFYWGLLELRWYQVD
ncbi:hypothetical protein PM082_014325 [Marasmius tenuissimus]|nr:hypothetical protein PM082_014325 [Marasmius tenuissimus]